MTTREFIIKWIEALRSGKYVQGKSVLARKEGEEWKYCCLGVACEVWQENIGGLKEEIIDRVKNGNGEVFDNVKTFGGNAWFPIKVEFFKKDLEANGLAEAYQTRLSILNDNDGKSFAEIADYIEKEILPKY